MADDGYLIGYEDSNNNFVEVGRFNNTAEDVTQPIIIQHSDSGQSIELGPDGFSTESVSTRDVTINDNIYYAADDAGLDASLSAASGGDKIKLGLGPFVDDRTISTELTIVGSATRFDGTFIDGDWDFTDPVKIKNVNLTNGSLTLSDSRSHAYHIDRADITVDGNRCLIVGINGGSVNVTSNSSATLLDALNDVSITDNGAGTVIGTTA